MATRNVGSIKVTVIADTMDETHPNPPYSCAEAAIADMLKQMIIALLRTNRR